MKCVASAGACAPTSMTATAIHKTARQQTRRCRSRILTRPAPRIARPHEWQCDKSALTVTSVIGCHHARTPTLRLIKRQRVARRTLSESLLARGGGIVDDTPHFQPRNAGEAFALRPKDHSEFIARAAGKGASGR